MSKEKLLLSGGYVNDRLIEGGIDLAGSLKPNIIVDLTSKTETIKVLKARSDYGKLFKTMGISRNSIRWIVPDDLAKVPSRVEHDLHEATLLIRAGDSTLQMRRSWQAATEPHATMCRRVEAGELVAIGASAGALQLARRGFSDSLQYENPNSREPWSYSFVPGDGFVDATVGVHFSDIDDWNRRRSAEFLAALQASTDGSSERAFGIDTMAALVCVDGIATAVSLNSARQPSAAVHVYESEATAFRPLEADEALRVA